jgi:hypothetical protein
MTSITDKWIYRVFYGCWIGALVFSFMWATIKSGTIPDVPWTTAALTAVLTGADAVSSFLKKPIA